MKCPHCKEDIGTIDMEHDAYDLMVSHRWDCNSEIGNKVRKDLEDEYNGTVDMEP